MVVVVTDSSCRPSRPASRTLTALTDGVRFLANMNFISIEKRLALSRCYPSSRSSFHETLNILSPCPLHFIARHRATISTWFFTLAMPLQRVFPINLKEYYIRRVVKHHKINGRDPEIQGNLDHHLNIGV